MTSKSDKEKGSPGKTHSLNGKETAKKTVSKPKKQLDEEDKDDELEEEETLKPVKKGSKVAAVKKDSDADDEEEDAVEDEPDDWEKPEEEENWDPDFEEFDIPKSKGKKGGVTGVAKKGAEEEDDFKFEDDEFKDLFGDKSYDDDEEDDY
jgi:DNA-directed RNA polymerase subunit delta